MRTSTPKQVDRQYEGILRDFFEGGDELEEFVRLARQERFRAAGDKIESALEYIIDGQDNLKEFADDLERAASLESTDTTTARVDGRRGVRRVTVGSFPRLPDRPARKHSL